jgi:hypothetical protein
MFSGKIPYVDFFTDTVPMVFYLASIPTYFANQLHLHPIMVFNFCVLSLSWILLILVTSLVKAHSSKSTIALVVVFALLPLLFRFQFGQIDYVFFVLFFPFMLARWLRWQGQFLGGVSSMGAGIAGGIAINLNPLFCLFPAALELFWFLKRRTVANLFSKEMKTFYLLCAFYWLHFVAYPAKIFSSILHSVISSLILQVSCHDPFLMYQGASPDQRVYIYIFAVLVTLGLASRHQCSFLLPLILFDFVAFMLFLLNGRGSSADLLLVNVANIMLLPVVCLSLLKALPKPNFVIARKSLLLMAISLTGLCLVYQLLTIDYTQFQSLKHLGYRGYQNKQDLAPFADFLEKDSRPGETVLFLTNEIEPAYPLLLQLRRLPGSYYLCGNPIFRWQLAYDQRAAKQLWQEQFEAVPAKLASDLITKRPVLVFLESGQPWEELRKGIFGEVLKDHYQLPRGYCMWDIDAFARKATYPFEYLGQRLDFDVFAREKEAGL